MNASYSPLCGAAGLLLDFDGPICDTFHGSPAPSITAELVGLVRARVGELPPEAVRMGPHDFLVWVSQQHPDLTAEVEQRLTRAEEVAVSDAAPTPYAADLVRVAAAAGRSLGIVSNNAGSAIRKYLDLHSITGIRTVCGRPGARTDRMKPDPWLLFRAAAELGVEIGDCVLVGDSDTDVLAAKAAGMPVIGYAATAERAAELTRAGADLVVSSLRALLDDGFPARRARHLPTD